MDTSQDNAQEPGQDFSQLTQEVAQLRDLFLRRLMDDKQRNRLYDAVVEQNTTLNRLLEERTIDAFVKEIFLICDRIESSGVDSDFMRSILDELHEVLARRGIVRIAELATFNPQLHNVIGTVPAEGAIGENTIVAVKRHGYTVRGRLLRAAEVIIAMKPERT